MNMDVTFAQILLFKNENRIMSMLYLNIPLNTALFLDTNPPLLQIIKTSNGISYINFSICNYYKIEINDNHLVIKIDIPCDTI
jgi:hypothetical protein